MLDTSGSPFVGVSVSYELDADAAVAEIASQIDLQDSCFVLVFLPDRLDVQELETALNAHLGSVPVFGCTTAGQITPKGYETEALLAISFSRKHLRCASLLIEPLKPLSIKTIARDVQKHASHFQRTAGWDRLALVFADGLSKQEDVLVSTLETALVNVPIFGGSAGNGLHFEQTFVLHDGKFRSNAALLLLLETDLRFEGLGFHHFLPTEKQLVVTEAEPEERLVLEINGAPAAQEYARLVGRDVEDLSPEVFAENPLLVRQNMSYHVRAIHGAVSPHALSFLCAIDDGLIMTLGRGKEIVRTLDTELDVQDEMGCAPDFILGFDCVLRKLEIEQKQMSDEISDVFRKRRVVGFNTYGEQHRGVHVNQTFVGVAFFQPSRRDLH